MIRNITFNTGSAEFIPLETTAAAPSTPEPSADITLRTRRVTVSPHEEYQLRQGEVRPISSELAAAILSFKGRAVIANKGVIVDRKDIGGRYTYFHEDSITLNDFSSREKKLWYVINRLIPDVLHLLNEDGTYIESLPLRERPAVLDNAAQAKQASENKTIINRAAKRLQDLHAEDTREALETMAENSREMLRVVQTLPAPSAQPVQPARSITGEAAAAGTRAIQVTRANKASAIALGRAISLNRRDPVDLPETPADEDWSNHDRNLSTANNQTPIEQW